MKQKRALNNGMKTFVIHDDKFQEVYISLKIMIPLEQRKNSVANILARMMGDRLESNPTKASITQRLDLMYGAKSGSSTYSVGSYQVIDIAIQAIHKDFVDENLLEGQLEFLKDSLYHPLLNENTFQEAKNNFIMSHHHVLENPSHHALVEGFKRAGKGQVFALNASGELNDLKDITLDDVIALHHEMIHQSHKEITVVGRVEDVVDFSMFEVGASEDLVNPLVQTQIAGAYEEEFYQGSQTELLLVYETSIDPHSDLYYAYLVYIAYLGQLPSSLLFQNIREKHSLCYSIYASRQIFDGIFYIATGIADKNLEQTLALIHEQVAYMKTGTLDLEGALSYLVLQLESVMEKQKPWSDHLFRNSILNVKTDIKEIQEALRNVSVEDVRKVAQMVSEPFVFAYRGNDDETH